MDPKISIIIPFFNSEKTLERAIKSVMSQSFSSWDLILVNDGSKDNSALVAESFLIDSRIRLLSQVNKGVSAARNLGASKAKSEWLLFLDADDTLREDSLSKMEEVIQKCPSIDYFHFGVSLIMDDKQEERLLNGANNFSKLAGSFLLKKTIFEKVGGYDEKLKFSENTELFHRIHLKDVALEKICWVSVNYFQSKTGGSKNPENILSGLEHILDKHKDTLTAHVKYLYHQSAGVIYIRFRDFRSARFHLLRSLKLKPWKLATWARLVLTYVKPLAKRLYKAEVNYG